jgi:hypothetical protein
MLAHIFYSFGFLFLIRTISSIYSFRKLHSIKEWRSTYNEVIGRAPKESEFRNREEIAILQTNIALNTLEILWLLIGLFTTNIFIFIFIIFLFMFVEIMTRSFKFTLFEKFLSVSFIFFRFSVYLLLIANHFVYKYNIWLIIKNWIW